MDNKTRQYDGRAGSSGNRKSRGFQHRLLCSAAILMAAGPIATIVLPAPAFAQAPSTSRGNASDSSELSEIVVTAEKAAHARSVQKVPISITAVDADTLAAIHSHDITDVARLAPNVELNRSGSIPGFANFTIRGIGVSNSNVSNDPAVNVVVDGMVYDFPNALILDTFGLSGIEIERGPQGILQGKNSTGGAVSLKTKRPTDTFEAQAEVGFGNFNEAQAAAMVSGPLVDDKLLGRIAVLHRSHDGYFKNQGGGTFVPAPGNPSGLPPQSSNVDQVGESDTIVRPTLVFRPQDNIDFSILGEFTRSEDGGGPAQAALVGPAAANLRALFGYTPPSGKFETNQDLLGRTHVLTERIIGELNWRLASGVITSITGYRHVSDNNQADADGTPFVILESPDTNQQERQFSEELRFASDFSNIFKFVAGVYYDKSHFDALEDRIYSGLLLKRAASDYAYVSGDSHQDAESAAGFANFEYTPIERLTFSAGGRYTWERKVFNVIPISVATPCANSSFQGCPTASAGGSKKWFNFSPRAGVNYQATDDLLLYATWTNGFRSGAYNSRASNLTALQVGPVNPEKVESFELGEKATFWDHRARVNLAAYYTKYNDMQRNILSGLVQYNANAATATIDGVEMDASVRPLKGWEFDGNFGWTNAKYDAFQGGNISWNRLIPNTSLKLDHVPEFTSYFAGSYSFEVPQLNGDITSRLSYAWRSSYFVDVGNTPYFKQKAYGLLDATVSYESEKWVVSAYAKNITNVRAFDVGNTILVPVLFGGEPTTYGVTVTFTY